MCGRLGVPHGRSGGDAENIALTRIRSPGQQIYYYYYYHHHHHCVCVMNILVKHRFCRLATGWTVWGSNPAETRFSVPSQTCPGAFPGVGRLGRDADHPSSSVGLRIDTSYTSASPLRLHRHIILTDSVDVQSVGC